MNDVHSSTQKNKEQNHQYNSNTAGQEKTKEQLSDVYAAGTSDGLVQLENETISLGRADTKDPK